MRHLFPSWKGVHKPRTQRTHVRWDPSDAVKEQFIQQSPHLDNHQIEHALYCHTCQTNISYAELKVQKKEDKYL